MSIKYNNLYSISKILFLVFSFIPIVVKGQIDFEEGYFIKNSGNRVDCLIKNLDWRNNPTGFRYKVTEESEIQTATIENIKEFGINESLRYVKATVNMDMSINASNSFRSMSSKRAPEFEEITIFLKLEVEGKANLYSYRGKNQEKYFFNLDSTEIEQLIFKLFKINDKSFAKNEAYKAQLLNNLKCENVSIKDVNNTDYAKKSLSSLFRKYNICIDPSLEGTQVENSLSSTRRTRDFINITIRPGINISSLFVENPTNSSRNVDFGNKTNFRIGVESEIILPFNKDKWSIFLEPTYQYYSSETQIPRVGQVPAAFREVTADYRSIEVPLGLRYYMFLNENFKFFVNTAYIFDFTMQGEVNYEESANLQISSLGNFTVGAGFDYNNLIKLEIRNGFNRDVLNDFPALFSDYTNFSLILGISIF